MSESDNRITKTNDEDCSERKTPYIYFIWNKRICLTWTTESEQTGDFK